MTNIRHILAFNLKEHRKKLGISQAKLAEKANITTQYIAMIEVSRKFPTPEMLDRLAGALEIESYELFAVKPSAENEIKIMQNNVIKEMSRTREEVIKLIQEMVQEMQEKN
jgi:transcriptional regulator with XRE-family HTH domain